MSLRLLARHPSILLKQPKESLHLFASRPSAGVASNPELVFTLHRSV